MILSLPDWVGTVFGPDHAHQRRRTLICPLLALIVAICESCSIVRGRFSSANGSLRLQQFRGQPRFGGVPRVSRIARGWPLSRRGARWHRHGPAQRASAAALALRLRHGRSPADRAAGPAYRRPDPGERDLCRPLRLRRQDRDLRRPLAVRDRAAVGRMGGPAARLRLAAPLARRGIRPSPAPMRAPWSANGSRSKAPSTTSTPGGPTWWRAASSRGSARRRWCCTTPT